MIRTTYVDIKVILLLVISNILSLILYYPFFSIFYDATLKVFAVLFTVTFLFTSTCFYKIYHDIIRFVIPKIRQAKRKIANYTVVSVLGSLIVTSTLLLSITITSSLLIQLIVFMATFKGIMMALVVMDTLKLLKNI